MKNPQALFEVSWEVCNMVGGIHTVIATKARKMQEYYGNEYFTIGPDIPRINEAAPVFREDQWNPAFLEGLSALNISCRMGRWLIPGEPQCLLVNFGGLHQLKDEILSRYWETYQLHSLYGGWDYLEPLFFGHAAGMLIEHIYNNHIKATGRNTVVHCHEWLSAAVALYLRKNVPAIGTVFTSHSTSLGRALAGTRKVIGLPGQTPASKLDQLAHEMGVSAKHSLETVAAKVSDCFSSVSTRVAEECVQVLHRKPDIILPNALGDEFERPVYAQPEAIKKARQRLFELAQLTTGVQYDHAQTDVLVSSGRYEFSNKGIDLLIEGLARLNGRLKGKSQKKVVAFLMYPAAHSGPRRNLLAAARGGEKAGQPYLCTHDLRDEANDPIIQMLKLRNLNNQPDNPVHVIFVPIYLDGADPLIPEKYYELLGGCDLTVFPVFYEPWGYTPLESIAYGVPTVTTDLAGFGRWVTEKGGGIGATGVYVLKRQQPTFEESSELLASTLQEFVGMPSSQRQALSKAALKQSRSAQWKNWGRAYFRAHSFAMQRAVSRTRVKPDELPKVLPTVAPAAAPVVDASSHLRKFVVLNRIPNELRQLRELSRNIWWSWNPDASELFSSLDPALWAKSGHNPAVFLDYLKPDVLDRASKSGEYLARLAAVYSRFEKEIERQKDASTVGFFCAEYGIANFLKFFSGGLGILAGDILKCASDMHLPMTAVGLAYRFGYFRQRISREGAQEHLYDKADFNSLPMELVRAADGATIVVTVPFPSGPVHVRAWKVAVGGVDLFLLDTDFDLNKPAERAITDRLYGGDQQHRLRQELVLGIGGFRFLKAINRLPDLFHMNEGHSAFLVLARLSCLIQEENLKFEEALEFIRHTSVFTTHTPVAAGHDRFPEDLLRPYLSPFEEVLHKDWSALMSLGQGKAEAEHRNFSVTNLAIKGSNRINGVSEIHGQVSRNMFKGLFPGLLGNEIPVHSITNGVHVPTWLAPQWQQVFSREIGADWRNHLDDPKYWEAARGLDPELVWKTHQGCKQRLVQWLRKYVEESYRARREDPANLALALGNLTDEALIVGFARRFAPYKRAALLFHDLKKLEKILSSSEKPVVFLFSGKAHPSDGPGQGLIKRIVELSRDPALAGKLIFVEGYDINVAQLLVSGCDVWLNNPTRPLEASGTSGMKAAINGCLNFSVPDGWWAEGYNGKNGWAIGSSQADETPPDYQNEYDSAEMYTMLRRDIIPVFFRRTNGIPLDWVEMMKESVATILPRFSAERMLAQYRSTFYETAFADGGELSANEFSALYDEVERKKRLLSQWDSITFLDVHTEGLDKKRVVIGEPIRVRIDVSHPNLVASDLAPQLVLIRGVDSGKAGDLELFGMELIECDDQNHTSSWQGRIVCNESGPHSFGVRVVPSEDHRQELLHSSCVQWL